MDNLENSIFLFLCENMLVFRVMCIRLIFKWWYNDDNNCLFVCNFIEGKNLLKDLSL